MSWLKQSTAATVKLGPFVDDTDGATPETALSIAQADIRLAKDGGDYAQSNNTAGATHDENGEYDVPLDSTDTNTLGRLRVSVNVSGALPVWRDFMVVPANVYDSLVGGSDALQVDATEISSSTTAADNVEANIPNLDAAVSSRSDFDETTDAVTIGTNNDKSGYSISGTKTTLDDLNDVSTAEVNSQVDTALSDIHLDHLLAVDTGASLPGAAGAILQDLLEDDGGTWRYNANALEEAPTGGSAPTAGEVADAVWDEAAGDHVGAGSFGEEVQAHAQSSELFDPATDSVTVGTNNDKSGYSVDTVNDKSGYSLSSSGIDAILDEPISEPSGVFSWGSATLRNIIGWIGALHRNKITQTSSTQTLRDDGDASNVATSSVSDDGTTFTRGEWS